MTRSGILPSLLLLAASLTAAGATLLCWLSGAPIESSAIGIAAALASCVLCALVLLAARLQPLRTLERECRSVERGDWSTSSSHTDRRDELGELARSFETLMQNLQFQRRRLVQESDTLEGRVRVRTQALQEIHEHLAELDQSKSHLLQGVVRSFSAPLCTLDAVVLGRDPHRPLDAADLHRVLAACKELEHEFDVLQSSWS